MSATLHPDVLNTLRTRYRLRLRDKVAAFRRHREALWQGDDEAEGSIRDLAHQVAGSGGSYGYMQLSIAARAVERAPKDELSAAVAALVDMLEACVAD